MVFWLLYCVRALDCYVVICMICGLFFGNGLLHVMWTYVWSEGCCMIFVLSYGVWAVVYYVFSRVVCGTFMIRGLVYGLWALV